MRVWLPSLRPVVFQVTPYVEVVSSAPMAVLVFRLNCTPATPVPPSEASAETVTEAPATLAPSAGAGSAAVGPVVSITRALLAPSEPAAPGDGRVSVAALREGSLMVPPLSASADRKS